MVKGNFFFHTESFGGLECIARSGDRGRYNNAVKEVFASAHGNARYRAIWIVCKQMRSVSLSIKFGTIIVDRRAFPCTVMFYVLFVFLNYITVWEILIMSTIQKCEITEHCINANIFIFISAQPTIIFTSITCGSLHKLNYLRKWTLITRILLTWADKELPVWMCTDSFSDDKIILIKLFIPLQ